MLKIALAAMFVILFLTQNAYAYLDPSAGNIVLQVLLGGIAGLFVFFKMYWDKIKQMVGLAPKDVSSNHSHDA